MTVQFDIVARANAPLLKKLAMPADVAIDATWKARAQFRGCQGAAGAPVIDLVAVDTLVEGVEVHADTQELWLRIDEVTLGLVWLERSPGIEPNKPIELEFDVLAAPPGVDEIITHQGRFYLSGGVTRGWHADDRLGRIIVVGDSTVFANNGAGDGFASTTAAGEVVQALSMYNHAELIAWNDPSDASGIGGGNRGLSGSLAHSDVTIARIQQAMNMRGTSFYYSMGINNLLSDQSGATTAANVIADIELLRQTKKPVHMLNVRASGTTGIHANLLAANAALATYWATPPSGVLPLDAYSVYATGPSDPTPKTNYFSDVTHPSPWGAAAFARAKLVDSLKRVYRPTRSNRPTGTTLVVNPTFSGTAGGSPGARITGGVPAGWLPAMGGAGGTATGVLSKDGFGRQVITVTPQASGAAVENFNISVDFTALSLLAGRTYQPYFAVELDGWAHWRQASYAGNLQITGSNPAHLPVGAARYEIAGNPRYYAANTSFNPVAAIEFDGIGGLGSSGKITLIETMVCEYPDPKPRYGFS